MLSVVAAAAALVALLAFAPFASAASDPLAGWTTTATLTLNKSFSKRLQENGVKVVRVKRSTVNGRQVTMPVTGGSLDPTTGKGTVVVNGGIKFKLRHGKAAIPFRNLTFNTTKNALYGKAGKKRMTLARISGLTATRNGFGVDLSIKSLKLTGTAARAVNKQLGFSKKKNASASSADSSGPLKGQQVMGGVSSPTQPSTVTVNADGNAVLVPDLATFAGKFPEHGVNPLTGILPISPATEVAGPAFLFPIAGGTLAPDASAGTVNSSGGIEIKSSVNSNVVQFTNLSVDFAQKTVLADNTVDGTATGRASIADLDMSKATVTSDSSAKTITVTGAVARLQSLAAALLNTQFPLVVPDPNGDFVAGDSLGTVSFTAHTQ